jgi:hypothetical protein
MKRSYTLARLFVLCFVLFLLHACSKQGDDNNEYVIQKETDINGNPLNKYEYNDKWQVSTHVRYLPVPRGWYTSTTNYFYNAAGRVERTENKTTNQGAYKADYSYDTQGRLILIKDFIMIGNTGNPVSPATIEYSYNGKEIVETYSYVTGVYYVATYTLDDNGNIVKKVTDFTDPVNIDTYDEFLDFDDKKNAGYPVTKNITSKNNCRKHIHKDKLNSYTEYFKYSYNNAGYVLKRMTFKENDDMAVSKYILIPKK